MFKKLIYLFSFALVLCLALSTVTSAALPGLVGYWRLDEGTGTAVGDASGNGNHGTLEGGGKWTTGKLDGGVYLDGVDDYIEIPNVISEAGTLGFWFKPDWDGSDPADYRLFDASLGGIYFFISKGANHADINPEDFGFYLEDATDADYQGIEINPAGVIFADTWFHVAVTWEFGGGPAILYLDGQEIARAATIGPLPALYENPRFGLQTIDYIPSANGAMSVIDDIAIFDRALTAEEIQTIMSGLGEYPWAWGPDPDDGTLYSDTWISLSWSAGDFAVSHDVYLGDNFDDVNDGVAETFQGNQVATNLVVGFPGFAYPDGLVPGTTYYWRIDEVNDTEPNSPWKGPVWSFTIPTTKAPVTKAHDPKPSDGVEFVELNVELSWTAGDGAKLHIVYFGENYDDVNNATGGLNQEATTYTPGPLELAKTYYWRVDELTGGRGSETHIGEVWSFTTQGAAVSPNPSNATTSVEMNATLSWEPADHTASHQVYFGTDKEVVRNANTGSPEYKGPKTLGDESYDPGILSWDTTYYWRVDEVNSVHPDSPWLGSVWSFTTADFLIIDDFEDYDIGNNEIWWAWIDGIGYASHPTLPAYPGNGTGSMVGDETTGSYMEETIVHGGKSMPVFYDNNQQGKSKYSEVELTLNTMRDWTEQGVTQLVLWFHGNVANAQEQMYVKLNGSKVVYDGDLADITRPQWKQWSIDLTSFGVNLQNVTSFIIGFGNDTNPTPGGSGTMYFDDIRLYRTAPEIVVPSEEIWFEAEAANTMTAPMTIWSDRADASGGQYIAVEPGNGSGANPPADGHATYDFEVRGGVYKITGRVITPSDTDDSFWFRIPGATTNTNNHYSGWVKWNYIPQDDNWHWDDVHSNDDGDQTVHFTLAAGTHTLEIAYREDGTLLDAFIITNKLD